ncbi:hypothetical protein QFZ67_001131 [Streptomyces sp. V1I1]|nr:hypothetical protein [Streptomyces sp. V1I1]
MAWREPGAGGESLDGEILFRVLGDVVLHVAKRLSARGLGGQLGAELRLASRASAGTGAGAAGHDQRVGDGGLGEAAVRDEGEAARGADRGAVQRRGADLVRAAGGPVGAREDLDRDGHVEALQVVEEDDEYGSLGHGFHPWRRRRWPQ